MYIPTILILLITNDLIKYLQAIEINLYHCNTTEKIDEIANIKKNLKRIIRNGDYIYFVLKNRIIFTRLIKIEKDFQGEEDINLHVNDTSLQIYALYEQKTNEIELIKDLIPANYEVLGHYFNSSTNETYEYYFTNQAADDNKVQKASKIYNRTYLLNFNHSSYLGIARRMKLEDLSESISDLMKYNSKIKYLSVLNDDVREHFYRFDYWHKFNKSHSTENTFSFKLTKLGSYYDWYNYRISEFPNTKFFIFYPNGLTAVHDNNFYHFTFFFGIDEATFLINFALIGFFGNMNSGLSYKVLEKFQFNFNDLFSCHTRFIDERQVKGLFYDNQTFFIFIKRFYLRISDDLIENEFKLDEDVYQRNALDLKFSKDFDYELSFEDSKAIWVKKLLNNTYFMPDNKGNYFLIKNIRNGLVLKPTRKNFNLFNYTSRLCWHSILVMDRHQFCFREDTYFHIYEEGGIYVKAFFSPGASFRINSIFEKANINWNPNQKVKFVFHYGDKKFIIMTKTDVFVFEKNKFRVTLNETATKITHRGSFYLTTKYESDDEFIRKRNRLFDPPEKKPKLPTIKKNVIDILIGLFIGLLILVLLLLILILVHLKKKNKQAKIEKITIKPKITKRPSSKLKMKK